MPLAAVSLAVVASATVAEVSLAAAAMPLAAAAAVWLAVAAELRAAGFRAEADLRNEKITYKIREHSMQKLPYQLIVGELEKAASKVAVRTRSGEDLGQMTLAEFIGRLQREVGVGSAA